MKTVGEGDGEELAKADSTLTFILKSLSIALKLENMTQAAAFLTNENKFWMHACRKGLKGGDFLPILRWYDLIEQNQDHL